MFTIYFIGAIVFVSLQNAMHRVLSFFISRSYDTTFRLRIMMWPTPCKFTSFGSKLRDPKTLERSRVIHDQVVQTSFKLS